VTGPVLDLVRRTAADDQDTLRPLALWSLATMGEPGAMKSLGSLLLSPDARTRQIAAYALRWVRERDPATMGALAKAAQAESSDSVAYAYLLSAAFALDADPAHRPAWRSALEGILASGSMDARFETCHGLLQEAGVADLSRYAPLLNEVGNDTRVGAALTILYVHARH
jgi:HEAT repeat protein